MRKKKLMVLFGTIVVLGLSACSSENQSAKGTNTPVATTKKPAETPKATKTPSESIAKPYNEDELKVLKESIMAGTIKNNVFVSKGNEFQMKVPNGWQLITEKDDVTLSIGKKDEKDRLKVDVSKKDAAFEENEKGAFEEYYSTLVDDFQFLEFEHIKIGGLPAIKMIFKCKTKGEDVEMTHYQYLIDGKCTYNVSFVEVESDMEQSVIDCMNSIKIIEK